MKRLTLILFLFIGFTGYAQTETKHAILNAEFDRSNCCQHLDEEYGKTWTILFWAKNGNQAKKIVRRYKKADIYNVYFKSGNDYYIELVDPSDLNEHIKDKYMIPLRLRDQVIYVDFLVDENRNPITNANNEKIIVI